MAPRPTYVLQCETSGSPLRKVSNFPAAVSLAYMEAFCGRLMSTRSSGRSDDGKNCRGMGGSARKEPTNSASERAIVSHFARMAKVRKPRYHRNTLPGAAVCVVVGRFKMTMPSSGAKMTATNHDTIRDMPTTAKSEKVYSPAELAAKPTGTKPAIVTSVPASMAK